MIFRALTEVAKAFDAHDVRYLLIGGVAVNIHGHSRATQDLDLVLQLDRKNLESAIAALGSLGFRPVIPEPVEGLLDPERRAQWTRDRNMVVFSLVSDRFPGTPVDLLIQPPFDFEDALKGSVLVELQAGVSVRVIGLADLISMKEELRRPRDIDDAEHLSASLRLSDDSESEVDDE